MSGTTGVALEEGLPQVNSGPSDQYAASMPELWQFPATYYNGTLHLHNTVTTPPDYTKSPSPLLETPNRIPSTATKLCTDIITPSNGVSKDP
eukprot:g8353.t1